MAMDDITLLSEYSRILGVSCLTCKHCNSKKPPAKPLECFLNGIRRVCTKPAGLSKETKLVKSCDKMREINTKNNPKNNPIYNARTAEKKREAKAAAATAVEEKPKKKRVLIPPKME